MQIKGLRSHATPCRIARRDPKAALDTRERSVYLGRSAQGPNQDTEQLKVLLVDDDMQFVETLAKRLKSRRMEATTALSGDDAIQLLREQDFDVVILDVVMPGKDGIETLKEIKSFKPLTEVIMLSGHASLELAIQGMQFGALDFLSKPADIVELVEKINKAFARKVDHEERIRKASFVRDHMQEAIAERDAGAEATMAPTVQGRLLVIGRESDFSTELIEYAIVVATRMSFPIVAMNAAGFDNESFRLFPTARERVCQEFREISDKNAALFRKAAKKRGVAFAHVVKFSEQDDAIVELRSEIGDIDYVVCECADGTNGRRTQDRIVAYAPV